MSPSELIAAAREAARNSYSPYSHYAVGAALLCSDGRVFVGTNVENASYGLTNCAERTAIFSAVAAGARDFAALAIVGGKDAPAVPCGACLQVMSEFFRPDTPIHIATLSGDAVTTRPFRSYFPHTFGL